MRFSLADPPPATVETHKTLKIHRYERGGRLCCKAWRGRQQKPFACYSFPNEAAREEWIERYRKDEDRRQEAKQQRAAERKAKTAEMAEQIQVGTILHYSWGYEQTQCEYFQVVAKRRRKVTVRQIGCRVVNGSEGYMSDRRKPDPGRFIGEPFDKMIGPWGIRMDHGTATPTDADAEHYCSWYH